MKTTRLSVMSAIGLGLLAASGASQAESQYGYDPSGTGTATASARLNITVVVPQVILLRVGSSGSGVDNLILRDEFGGVPGGVTTMAGGGNQPTGWDGTQPALTTTSSGSIQAWAWTNSSSGGTIMSAVTTEFPASSGLTANDVTVTSAPMATTGLAHPGTNAATSVPTLFPRNVVATSMWTFAVTQAIVPGRVGGRATLGMTYTAATL